MNIILCMAISIDGKTTGKDDDTSWVSEADVQVMDALMDESGVMVMGSKTYDSFGDDLPSDKALQVVLTTQPALLNKQQENVIFTDATPRAVVNMLEERGYTQLMIAGGHELNTSFLKAGLIDEVRLIQVPLVLGEGKPLFGADAQAELQLKSVTKLETGRLEVIYTVVK